MSIAPASASAASFDRTVPAAPPRSVVSGWDPVTIAAIVIATYLACLPFDLSDLAMVVINLVAISAVMVPLTILRAPWRGLPRPVVPAGVILRRATIKTVGILAGIGLMLLGWGLLHAYRGAYSQPLFEMMPYVLPWLPFAIAATVWYTEWRLGPYEDHGWQFGMIVLGRWHQVDWRAACNGLFGWVVKGFFLPMNFCTSVMYMHEFREASMLVGSQDWFHQQDTIMHGLFLTLLLAIIPGYVVSSRLLGTENRRIDVTGFGWLVTLMCYPPFNSGSGGWFFYEMRLGPQHVPAWQGLTGNHMALAYAIGGVIILSELLHYFGESICCMRSSHLSQRGVISTGLFRVTKHPVYVAKFIGWGLMWLPFMSAGRAIDDVRQSLGFLLFALVYVLRAWVEERVMSSDPDYVAYARWMEGRSWLRFMGRVCPFFNYEWRLRLWIVRGQVVVQDHSLTWADEPLCRTAGKVA